MKFHENVLNGLQVIDQARNVHCQISKGNNSKIYRQELSFLWSAHHLMIFYISMKVHDNLFNNFHVIEWTQNTHCQISMGNNYKNVQTNVEILVVCMLSDDALYFCEVSLKTLNVFSGYRADMIL